MPDALYFTEDEAANQLLAEDPFALLVGFALDQQVTVQQAFLGPLRLKERLGTLEPRKVAQADLEPLFREKPAIHRFPGSMAGRVRDLAATVAEEYDGDASRLWTEAADGADLRQRIAALPGFGEMKVKALGSVLAKRFGVPVGAGARAGPSHARGRRLGPGARRLPGREESAQGGVAGVEVRTLTDGGQPAERDRPRTRRVRRRREADARDRDLRLQSAAGPERDRLRRARRAAEARRRRPARVQPRPREGRRRCRRRRITDPGRDRGAAVPHGGDPGRSRPHAPQVRRPRRRLGLDRLDELDGRLVDARGERDRHGRLAGARGALPRGLRAALDDAQRRAQRQGRHRPRGRTACAPGSARAAARSSRTGSRRRSARRSAASGSPRR